MLTRCLAVGFWFLLLAGAHGEKIVVTGSYSPDCDYSKYMGHLVTIRGALQLATYGGGASPNVPKWTTAYVLSTLPHMKCGFEVHPPRSIRLASFDGYVVEITGKVTEGGRAAFYTLTAQKIRRVRHYDG
ncbi:MAG: hypothetical protein QOJ87_98 [Verrucomicrobiota bacterium]|jgi:hypothetical protein